MISENAMQNIIFVIIMWKTYFALKHEEKEAVPIIKG